MKQRTREELHELRQRILARPRNNTLFDIWSIVHLVTGALAGWVVDPFVALLVLVLWEPLEVLVLSPWLARHGIEFGRETLRNSLSDIFFDAVGVAIGFYGITALWGPPFHLF